MRLLTLLSMHLSPTYELLATCVTAKFSGKNIKPEECRVKEAMESLTSRPSCHADSYTHTLLYLGRVMEEMVMEANMSDSRSSSILFSSISINIKTGSTATATLSPWISHDLELTSNQFCSVVDSASLQQL